MMKHALTGVMALGLFAGVAHAQDASVSRDRTVVTQPDGDRVVHDRTTVNKETPYGEKTVTKNTVRRTDGWDGDTSTTRRTTVNRDTPYGDTRSTTVQRTTTDR